MNFLAILNISLAQYVLSSIVLGLVVLAIFLPIGEYKLARKIYRAGVNAIDKMLPKNEKIRVGIALACILIVVLQFLYTIVRTIFH